jgi:hypothetical protein
MFLQSPPHRVFNLPNASPEFALRVHFTRDEGSNDEPLLGAGVVTIVSRATGKAVQTIRMPSIAIFKDQMAFSVGQSGKQPALYDDEYSFVFEDFNFDGHPDLAICKDTQGSYGGPTYDIFLWNPARHLFVRNAQLSKLSSEHLGLIEVDRRNRELITADKSGAAWHMASTYKYFGKQLRLIETEVDDQTGPKDIVTTRRLVGGKWRKTVKFLREAD